MDPNSSPSPDGFIGKLFSDRLGNYLISFNQFGFIEGRNIHEAILLVSEGVNCLHRSNASINMVVKVDVRKVLMLSVGTLFFQS